MRSDADLVDRVRRGDIEAFSRLSERYEKTVLAAALCKTRDIHTAEDVVQETLLLAFRRLDTLRDPSKFGPWLMQIVRRQLIEAFRKRPVPTMLPLDGPERVQHDDAPIDTWIEHDHMLTLVARLPDHEAVLIGLRYFDGQSVADVAAIVARPVGTVTKQLSRAIARLRAWYDQGNLR